MAVKIYERKMGQRCTKTFYTTPQLIAKIQEIADIEKQYQNGMINKLLKMGINDWLKQNQMGRFYVEDDVRHQDPEDGPIEQEDELDSEEQDQKINPHLYD